MKAKTYLYLLLNIQNKSVGTFGDCSSRISIMIYDLRVNGLYL